MITNSEQGSRFPIRYVQIMAILLPRQDGDLVSINLRAPRVGNGQRNCWLPCERMTKLCFVAVEINSNESSIDKNKPSVLYLRYQESNLTLLSPWTR